MSYIKSKKNQSLIQSDLVEADVTDGADGDSFTLPSTPTLPRSNHFVGTITDRLGGLRIHSNGGYVQINPTLVSDISVSSSSESPEQLQDKLNPEKSKFNHPSQVNGLPGRRSKSSESSNHVSSTSTVEQLEEDQSQV